MLPYWVSLIVPARDEGLHVEGALASKLACGYPSLEVVAIDDRSADETGAIIDRAAARDPRLVAVHVTELPDGWLGKVHAMARGLEACGVRIEEDEDTLIVHGMGPGGVQGGAVAKTHIDHRIAMSFLVCGLAAKAEVGVDDGSPIQTSFPMRTSPYPTGCSHMGISRRW